MAKLLWWGRGTPMAAVHRMKVPWQVQDEAREIGKGQIMQDLKKDFGLYHKNNGKLTMGVSQGEDVIDIPLEELFLNVRLKT